MYAFDVVGSLIGYVSSISPSEWTVNRPGFVKFNEDDFVALALVIRLKSRVRQGYVVTQLVDARYECLHHQ